LNCFDFVAESDQTSLVSTQAFKGIAHSGLGNTVWARINMAVASPVASEQAWTAFPEVSTSK
jgi:hypothetical protein